MASNGSSTNPSTTLTSSTAPATKKGRGKSGRKSASAQTASPATKNPSTALPNEILYTDLPNPYHPTEPPFIWIDHPEQNERLTGPVYVIRLGVGGAEHVELSIDGGVWQKCRLTSGYWWYDWSGIQPGRHTLAARMRMADGRWFRTPPRNIERRP